MTAFLITVHILVSIALIIIVLLQGGKGAEIGASFGSGGSQTVFGATGGKSFLSKMTTGAAVVFMLTSLALTYFYSQPSTVMPSTVSQTQQGSTPVPAPGQTTATPVPGQTTPAEQPAAPVQSAPGQK